MDILFLAAIAAFILYRLYRVLGQDVGLQKKPNLSEPIRPNFGEKTGGSPKQTNNTAKALENYRTVDSNFDPSQFIEGAQGAFEMILKAYTEADRETLDHLLSPDLRKRFETSLKDREKKKEEVDNSLIRIKSSELIDISIEKKKTAVAKVKYVSDQILVTYNEQGHVIEGDPDFIETLTEIWTFKRDINSNDPNWKLYETESLD